MTPAKHRDAPRPIWVAALALLMLASPALAAEVGDSEAEGKEKLLLMGIVLKVEDSSLLIAKPAPKKEEIRLGLSKDTKFGFVGFQGIGQEPDKPGVGFAVKANLTKDNIALSILFSPDLPPLEEIPDKHLLTAEQLFKAADLNANGEVDYVEYATKIFQSYKHLPDRFQSKMDSDKDDVLNLQEFTATLDNLEWWRLSRKTGEEWVSSADKDKSGQLEKEEAKAVTGSAHGNFDKLFEKLDRDKSGGLTVSELEPFLKTGIFGKSKSE